MNKPENNVKQLLSSAKKIVITTHSNPDGDAMGSGLALMHFLRQTGHDVNFITPTYYANYYNWLPGSEHTITYPKSESKAKQLIEEADVFFGLDYNALPRIGDLEEPARLSKAVKIVIDHHRAPDDFPDHLFSDVNASSTAEMVYDFIIEIGGKEMISKEIGECIYTGILADTGAFQFSSTSPKVLRISAYLIELGVDGASIYQKVFNNFSELRLRLIGYCITERMKLYEDCKTAVMHLTKEDLQKFKVKTGFTEGLVNFPLKMQDVNFAVLIIDRTERIKLSFRSKGDFDVNQFARNYFNGGGHKNAAGGQSTDSLESVIDKFEEVLPKYQSELNY